LGDTIDGSSRGEQIKLMGFERDAGAPLCRARQSPLEVDHLIGPDRRVRVAFQEDGQR
jgi:hypothetical protein